MNFKILSDLSKIHEGQIIKYKVSPFPFFRVGWTTEITKVDKPFLFIDEQRKGPFSIWHHEHTFQKRKKWIISYNKVTCKLTFGFLGIFFGERIVKN